MHLAYALASGQRDLLQTRLLVCHIHEYYHLEACLGDFPGAEIVYCTRDPRNALVSTVEHLLDDPDRRNVYFLTYWLKWIIREAELALQFTPKVKMLPLERLHLHSREVLAAFCRDFGLEVHDCLFRSTYQGRQWWGDVRSRCYLKGFNPRVAEPKWKTRLSRIDSFVLEMLLSQRLTDYGYAPGPRRSVGRMLTALFLIPLPMRYELELAWSDCRQEKRCLTRIRSVLHSLLSYGDRVLFYYRRWWKAWRNQIPSPAHYALCVAACAGASSL